MKKTLILASLLMFAVSAHAFAEQPAAAPNGIKEGGCYKNPPVSKMIPPAKEDLKNDKKAEFEKRLKLTDEQKAKAKAIREKGHEQMKPVMDAIRAKREEINTVRLSRIAVQAQEEAIAKLRGEIRELKKQARDIRMKNMKEFEAILDSKQLKELQKMKNEGRKKFEKEFKKKHGNTLRPPFPPEFGRPPMGPPHPDCAELPPPPPKAPDEVK